MTQSDPTIELEIFNQLKRCPLANAMRIIIIIDLSLIVCFSFVIGLNLFLYDIETIINDVYFFVYKLLHVKRPYLLPSLVTPIPHRFRNGLIHDLL